MLSHKTNQKRYQMRLKLRSLLICVDGEHAPSAELQETCLLKGESDLRHLLGLYAGCTTFVSRFLIRTHVA